MRTNLTKNNYQSKVLPIIEKAETEIKKLINYYALYLKPKRELRERIDGIIKAVSERLPISLFERYKYILGLKETSERMIRDYYDKVVDEYKLLVLFFVMANLKKPENPLAMVKAVNKHKTELSKVSIENFEPKIWAARKGYPNVIDYPKKLKERIGGLAKTQTVSSEAGKKPITVWQKAELDLRHENQLNMIDNLKAQGVKLAWTSTHPDCSKRCEKWQGKLFDLDAPHAELSGFRMKYKVDGNTVYCFNDVINQIDKYGYTNNIIVGFNCRHKLRPYESGSVAPQEYSGKDIKRERAINAKLRAYERQIRYLKQQAILYNSIDKNLANKYKQKAKATFEEYKQFANKNGYAWYEYRVEV